MAKKICFIAQFPPPYHGLSQAVETLYSSDQFNEYDFEKIDITNNVNLFRNLYSILKSKADLFYFTISQTRIGNLRDLIIFKILNSRHKKCLVHLHGGYYRKLIENDIPKWQRKINFQEIAKLSGVIVLGPTLRPIFDEMIDSKNIYMVPNCVDDQYIITDDEFFKKQREMGKKDVLDVLYLSNFIKSKGYQDVLEMAKFEREKVASGSANRYHFHFAGSFFREEDKIAFYKFITNEGLENIITYHGVVQGKEKKELLKKSDVFVLLSRYPKEGQPISILEAMGNGLVIVTTDHAGIPDIAQPQNGIVCTSEINAEAVMVELKKLDIQKISKINRDFVARSHLEKQYIENMRHCFKMCL